MNAATVRKDLGKTFPKTFYSLLDATIATWKYRKEHGLLVDGEEFIGWATLVAHAFQYLQEYKDCKGLVHSCFTFTHPNLHLPIEVAGMDILVDFCTVVEDK